MVDVGNQVLVDPQQLAVLQANLKSQYQVIEEMAREAEKKAEVAKFNYLQKGGNCERETEREARVVRPSECRAKRGERPSEAGPNS